MASGALRVLIVDLNNFARYPTIAVGYLAAVLRRAGVEVSVLSPLAFGVPGIPREPRARPWSLLAERLKYWTAVSAPRPLRYARAVIGRALERRHLARAARVATEVRTALAGGSFDAVLISAYLMYRPVCDLIGRACAERRTPLILGGPYFSQPEVAAAWRDLPGLAALVGGEVEPWLASIVADAAAGRDLSAYPGVWLPSGGDGGRCPPLRDLDALPYPDYTDFPWQAYPNRIVPIITGRGCAWGACTFCSDVTSSAGRTFRSRSAGNVLEEIEHQGRRYGAALLAFTDLKLNSDLGVWRGLLDGAQERLPGGRWIASVHIGCRAENGLSSDELRAARAAGMVRLTTGLESGSQRVLDSMAKGTDLALTSRTLRAAAAAGISVRTTMIVGYPGEEAPDVLASARFLREHSGCIDRVRLNRFSLMLGTAIQRRIERRAAGLGGLVPITVDGVAATVSYRYAPAQAGAYARAAGELIGAAQEINRRPLPHAAADFEGVM